MTIRFILVQNRRGKTRLQKWYQSFPEEEKERIRTDIGQLVGLRDQKDLCNFVEWRNYQIVYRRYAGLYFCMCVDANDNPLAVLESIHFLVDVLDTFFKNVCELDLVFDFFKVYAILDEIFLAGEFEEANKTLILKRLEELEQQA